MLAAHGGVDSTLLIFENWYNVDKLSRKPSICVRYAITCKHKKYLQKNHTNSLLNSSKRCVVRNSPEDIMFLDTMCFLVLCCPEAKRAKV